MTRVVYCDPILQYEHAYTVEKRRRKRSEIFRRNYSHQYLSLCDVSALDSFVNFFLIKFSAAIVAEKYSEA